MENFYQLNNRTQATPSMQLNEVSKKYCSYHKSNYHNTSECRARNDVKSKSVSNTHQNLMIKPNEDHGESKLQPILCAAHVNGKPLELLIDTGASENFMSDRLAKILNVPLVNVTKSVELANGTNLTISKKITLSFELVENSRKFEETFFILPSLPYDGVLGTNFMSKHGCRLDFISKRLSFSNVTVPKGFGMELHHVKGEENVGPDLLSRCLVITKGSLQQDNQSLLALITHSENSQRLQENSTKETNVQKISKDCFLTDQQNRIIVPNKRIDEFLQAAHEHLAHPGIHRLCKTLSSGFVIKNIFHRIQQITTNCQVCQLNKSNNTQYGKLHGFLTAKKPFERIAMDLLGPIDITAFKSSKEEGKAMVLVIIDIFSKWIRIVPLKRITAACVVKALRTEWIEKYGR